MRSSSKKKQVDYNKTGGPVYKITVPKFSFDKLNYGEKYQDQIDQPLEASGPLKSKLSKTGSLLKQGSHVNEGEKKEVRPPSGKKVILKPLDDEALKHSQQLGFKQSTYKSNTNWINDLTKKESIKIERPARNPDRLNDTMNRNIKGSLFQESAMFQTDNKFLQN